MISIIKREDKTRNLRSERRRPLSFVFLVSFFVFYLSDTSLTAEANELSELANSMQPGTWARLNVDGDSSGYGLDLMCPDGVGCVTGFAYKAAYDPIATRVHFTGSPHN